MQRLFCFLVAGFVSISCSISSRADDAVSDLDQIVGDWVNATPGQRLGEPITFKKVFGGYDALISWWGQTTITASQGEHGSHIKIVGNINGSNVSCFYYITILKQDDMIWAYRFGDSTSCPNSVEFKKPSGGQIQRTLEQGQRLLQDKDYDSAIAAFKYALSLEQQNAEALNGLGDAYYGKSDYNEAIARYSSAIASDAKPLYYSNRCLAYIENGDNDEAISSASGALQLDESYQAALSCRATAYEANNDWSNALRDRKKAAELDQDDTEAQDALASLISKTHLFKFTICNKTDEKVFVALIGVKEPGETTFVSSGWYSFDSGECGTVGSYLNKYGVYYSANSRSRKWGGDKGPYCVGSNDEVGSAFHYETEKHSCSSNSTRTFKLKMPTIDQSSFSLNLTQTSD